MKYQLFLQNLKIIIFNDSDGNLGMISTAGWQENYSPPSIFEYLVNTIVALILYMDDDLNLKSYKSVKGCVLDYNWQKKNNKISILTGYMSNRVRNAINHNHGKEYEQDIDYLLGRKWLGSYDDRGSGFMEPQNMDLKKIYLKTLDLIKHIFKRFLKNHHKWVPLMVAFVGGLMIKTSF